MGMGWKKCNDCNDTEKESTNKCSCGQGYVVTYLSYSEESDYPPFFRGESRKIECTCKNPKCADYQRYSK